MMKRDITFGDSIISLVLNYASTYIFAIVLGVVIALSLENQGATVNDGSIESLLMPILLLMPIVSSGVVWLYIRLRRGVNLLELRTHRESKKEIGNYIVPFVIMLIGINCITNPIIVQIPSPSIEEFEQMLSGNETMLMAFALAAIIVAPIAEELLYRGVLVNGIKNKFGTKAAIIGSSLVFAVAHGNVPQGIGAFTIGILLAYAYIKTESLWVPILLHFINNLSAFFIIEPMMLPISLMISPLIGAIIIYIGYKKLIEVQIIGGSYWRGDKSNNKIIIALISIGLVASILVVGLWRWNGNTSLLEWEEANCESRVEYMAENNSKLF